MIFYTKYHFAEEESLLRLYRYPNLERHAASHRRLMAQAEEFQRRLSAGESISAERTSVWLKAWVIEHVETEDKKYSAFLNSKHVY